MITYIRELLMDFKLGEEQELAINAIIEFITNSKEIPYSLIGYAGTGKSTIIKCLVDYMEDEGINYVLCAPTHKAKSVMKYATDRDAMTVHQVLKLTPNIEILELDLRDLQFMMNKVKTVEIPYKGVIMCDESSMINDALFNLLNSKCKECKAKIVFIGDIAQLKPVKSVYSSLVFNVKDLSELKTIYRQSEDSGLVTVLPTLRTSSIGKFKDAYGKEGSLITTCSAQELFTYALPCFKTAIENKDIFEAKMYAYTNVRSQALNSKVRHILFPGEEEYYQGEILTAYENFSYGWMDYFNSMDYIIDEVPRKYDKMIPNFTILPGYMISLYDTAEKNSGEVFILSRDIPSKTFQALSSLIEVTRNEAVIAKQERRRGVSLLWKEYYDIINSFASPIDLYYDGRVIKKRTFDYGYASTVHKSQGSSINNVFIDMKNIAICRDEMELRQLQYVSVSRTRKNAHILQ